MQIVVKFFLFTEFSHFRQTPDDSNNTVFNKGNSKGLIACIPIGGHCAPNSILGDNALWKNVQKIAKKKRASETINKATPKLIPL